MSNVKTYQLPDEQVYSIHELDDQLDIQLCEYLNRLSMEDYNLLKGKSTR